MTKLTKILARLFFTVSYATFSSVGMACFFHLFSLAFVASWLDESYPRLIPFCEIVPIICVVALICLLIWNIKLCDRLDYTRDTWIVQSVCAFAISIAMIPLWGKLIVFLQDAL